MIEDFNTMCICGSMRFYQLMLRFAEYFTRGGFIVLMPFVNKVDIDKKNDFDRIALVERLDKMHKVKMKMADIVLVVTGEIGENYIGDSTQSEITYAKLNNKPIVYSNEVLESLKLSTTIPDAL